MAAATVVAAAASGRAGGGSDAMLLYACGGCNKVVYIEIVQETIFTCKGGPRLVGGCAAGRASALLPLGGPDACACGRGAVRYRRRRGGKRCFCSSLWLAWA